MYFDHVDNMEPAPEDVTILQQLIFEHFNISDRYILGNGDVYNKNKVQ